LIDPLKKRWQAVKSEAETLLAGASGPLYAKNREKARDAVADWLQELSSIRVLDPACGSGNFLYLALKRMLDIWKEAHVFCYKHELPVFGMHHVSPKQLYGIEKNSYAHELASTVVWIGYLQWQKENGIGEDKQPILDPLNNIQHRDAILEKTLVPLEPEWPETEYIIGNPPFLGGNKIRNELGDEYVNDLFSVYSDRVPRFADLVCYWFEKARAHIETGKCKRAGLLATQGIRGGVNRVVLERIKETGNIFWAQSDRDWILDGATVHVSMVAFDDGSNADFKLNDDPVAVIHADLTSHAETTSAEALDENKSICFMGPSPKGPFDISHDRASEMLQAPININGRPNSDVVRPVASGIDLVQLPRNIWTIDFGTMSGEDAARYQLPFEYVNLNVKPIRTQGKKAQYGQKWWQYGRPRIEMREALTGLKRHVATPATAKHRIFVWVDPKVLCNQGTLVFARDDDYFFGVLHSRAHEVWARRQGTQVREAESGFRYTPTSTFETFPFPWPPGREAKDDLKVQAIASAAGELVNDRDKWLNPPGASQQELSKRTLTNLYNDRPTWLDNLHRKLDEAVFAAYGWPSNLTDAEILERLLALNHQRAGIQPNKKTEE
jgi:type II restriction/modification system DNA methylase subunit YeeA